MSIFSAVTIKCDWIGCSNRLTYNHVESTEYTRARAAVGGWRSDSNADYCRQHAKQPNHPHEEHR